MISEIQHQACIPLWKTAGLNIPTEIQLPETKPKYRQSTPTHIDSIPICLAISSTTYSTNNYNDLKYPFCYSLAFEILKQTKTETIWLFKPALVNQSWTQ